MLSESKKTRQKKAISALAAFGKFVAVLKNTNVDPARDLTEKVRRAAEERAVAAALRRAGLSSAEIADLRWRDILAGIFVGTEPTIGSSALTRDETTARHLGQKFLERLHSVDIDELPGLLIAPVFGSN